jgi:hypothetical protein
MFAPRLRQLRAAADLLQPKTLFRALARVDQLSDRTRDLQATVDALRIRTEQLETIVRLDLEHEEELLRLPALLDAARIRAHVERAVATAPMICDPFPHVVVSNWLPADMYEAMIRGLPPAVFFADREEVRQRLIVPFSFAPAYSRRVWTFIAQTVVGEILRDALSRKFETVLREYVRGFCGAEAATTDVPMSVSDGRIMLRRPGYVIPPHRDPKWGFVTGLVYLARHGDNEAYGTQLYRVRDDREAPNDKPWYIDASRCELAEAVPFRANTMLAFINSWGAHGASIPADATPATLERYVYQFRLGPDSRTIKQLLALMPPEHRAQWAGAKSQKAAGMSPAPPGSDRM